jgi:hypothetical protein
VAQFGAASRSSHRLKRRSTMHRLVSVVLALLIPAAALAEERATTKEAEGIVHSAVGFMQKEGKDKAFASFTDPRDRPRRPPSAPALLRPR